LSSVVTQIDAALAAALEMDAEIGDERARSHVHRRRAIEEGGSEPRRVDLHDVVAGRGKRNADDLERSRLGPESFGRSRRFTSEAPDSSETSRVSTKRSTRRLMGPILRVGGVLDGVPLRLGRPASRRADRALVIARDPRVPRQDVGIGLETLDANAAGVRSGCREVALHVPQRDRQHRIGAGFDDAERRGREFRERRRVARRDLERKVGGSSRVGDPCCP
jgi:hypothetical protein